MTYSEKRLQEFRELLSDVGVYGRANTEIEAFLSDTINEIKSDLIKIADKGEYEDLRREVEGYFGKEEGS